MSTIPLAGLRTELLSAAYDADRLAGKHATLADRLNAATDTRNRLVPLAELFRYIDSEMQGASRSLWLAIKDRATASGAPAASVEASRFLAEMRAQRWYDTADTSKPIFATAINVLVSDGTITTAQQTAIAALRPVPASRAEILWGVGAFVTPEQVGAALSPDFQG